MDSIRLKFLESVIKKIRIVPLGKLNFRAKGAHVKNLSTIQIERDE